MRYRCDECNGLFEATKYHWVVQTVAVSPEGKPMEAGRYMALCEPCSEGGQPEDDEDSSPKKGKHKAPMGFQQRLAVGPDGPTTGEAEGGDTDKQGPGGSEAGEASPAPQEQV